MIYESIFSRLLFPLYETFVKGRGTASYAAEYRAGEWRSQPALQQIQLEKLNALLSHCWAQVPFLESYWRDHGCEPQTIRDLAQLEAFPLLDKKLISDNYDAMIARNWVGKTMSKTTGGSTGDPFRFEYTMDVYARRTAVMWRGYSWAGAGLGTRTAYVWGSAGALKLKDRLYHAAFNRRFFDAFAMSENNLDRYVDGLIAYRPQALVGYVAPVVMLARRMRKRGIKMAGLRAVVTGAEALYASERHEIEDAFGCPVFNTYGTREVMLIAAECSQHDGLHVNADHLILETVAGDGTATASEQSGNVAITDLHNFGMPMVRYLNGDRATWAAGGCSCGRHLPLLKSVDGRILEIIRTPDGKVLLGEFFVYLMLQWPEVTQWQVVQTEPGCIEFRLVVRQPWSAEAREKLVKQVQQKSGLSMRINVVEVAAIETTASGKRRLTVALQPS